MIHQWLYFIGPLLDRENNGLYKQSDGRAFLFAYCKGCNHFYSEEIPTSRYGPMLSEAHVPREGCAANRAAPIPSVIRAD